MDEVIMAFHKNYDIIIVSDFYKVAIEIFLKKHALLQYIDDIFAINGMDGDFITSPCASCYQYSCKTDIVKSFKQNKNYKTTTYVIGNGRNADLCPILDLASNDRVYARN